MVEVKRRTPLSPDLVALLVALLVPTAIVARWAQPRAAIPTEMPALASPSSDVAADLAAERALAERAPTSDTEVRRRELYRAQGLAEVRADDTPSSSTTRMTDLADLAATLSAAGDLDAARAADIARGMAALRGEGTAAERAREAGMFAASLRRWGAERDGRRVASELVVRALFHARWNAVHAVPLTEGMSPVRLQAYHGWLALHADAAPAPLRAQAIAAYAAAGGARASEAEGVLAHRDGEAEVARAAFLRAYDETGSVRLRNHALAVGDDAFDDDLAPEPPAEAAE